MRGLLIVVALAAAVAPCAAQAKKEPHASGLELQQIQSRDFEVPKNLSFSAVMSVLQDEGYRIGSADKDTGLITAIASTQSHTTFIPFIGFGKKKRTPVVSAFIEERGASNSRIRLNFVMGKYSANQYGSNADEEPITDPVVYQEAFEKISKAIFVRQSMDSPASGAPAAQAQAPAQATAPSATSGGQPK